MNSSQQHVLELGSEIEKHLATFPQLLRSLRENLDDPLAADRFAMQCATLAAEIGLLGERSQALASLLLDEDEEN